MSAPIHTMQSGLVSVFLRLKKLHVKRDSTSLQSSTKEKFQSSPLSNYQCIKCIFSQIIHCCPKSTTKNVYKICKVKCLSLFKTVSILFKIRLICFFRISKPQKHVKQLTLHLQNYEQNLFFDFCIYICIYISRFFAKGTLFKTFMRGLLLCEL